MTTIATSVLLFTPRGLSSLRRASAGAPRPSNVAASPHALLLCGTVRFNRTDFGAGTDPRAVAVGEFNGDGRSDLAVVNHNVGTVSILLGNGAGGFGAANSFAAGVQPISLAIADFNGDTRGDIVVTNEGSTNVTVLLGGGDGSFGPPAAFTTAPDPTAVAVGDFNGDGDRDLVTTNASGSNTVSVLLGNGDGTFGAHTDFAVGVNPHSVAVADFNGDTNSDLVVANVDGGPASISVLLGTGTGTFGAAAGFAAGSTPFSVAVADFNGDARSDVVVGNTNTATASVLLGDGTGGLGAANTFGTGLNPFTVAVGDLNGDGRRDVATANLDSGNVSVLLGTGGGGFAAALNFDVGFQPTSIALGDFDADGQLDLVTTNSFGTASVLVNTCDELTLPVINTNDSGPGSLRQAILDSNASVGQTETITFNIPGGGVRTIQLGGPLPDLTDPVVIDGYTQPGSSPNTLANGDNAVLLVELDGSFAGPNADGLRVVASGSTVRGLIVNRFSRDGVVIVGVGAAGNGDNVTVRGNFIGTDATGALDRGNVRHGVSTEVSFINHLATNNQIGGATPADRNVISGNNGHGIQLGGAPNNVIRGNFIGLAADGTAALGNSGDGIRLTSFSGDTIIGGDDAADGAEDGAVGARNVVSGNAGVGIGGGSTVPNNIVRGNFIGTDATGTLDRGNGNRGISFDTSGGHTIGGATAGAGNLISGNNNHGIEIAFSNNCVVQGNRIGTQANGAGALGNAGNGVHLSIGTTATRVGGEPTGEGNTVAFNSGVGVRVESGTQNRVLANSIHSNAGLGIDLGPNGVTPNDAGDPDGGANNLQNFPTLAAAAQVGIGTNVTGALDSTASTSFLVEFFANTSCDATSNGEGQRFLGARTVSTNASGGTAFNITLPSATAAGEFVTATATGPAGNTSEFSPCRVVFPNGGLTITGRVTDGAGGLAGVAVTLSGAVSRVVRTDADGNYVFDALTPGADYTVAPNSPYFVFSASPAELPGLFTNAVANFTTDRLVPPAPLPPPSDDFESPGRDADKWRLGTLTQPQGGFAPAVTVAEQGGRLVIQPQPNTTGAQFNGYVSVNSFDLTGNSAAVELVQAGANGTATVYAVGEDNLNFYRFVVAGPNVPQAIRLRLMLPDAVTNETLLFFQVRVAGVLTQASLPYDPVLHRLLRFRHDAEQNAINFETSPEVIAWTTRRSFGPLQKGVSALACELSAGTGSAQTAPGQVVFDNFQLTTNTLQLSAGARNIGEDEGSVLFTVTRRGAINAAALVRYEAVSRTASARSDFLDSFGVLAFAPGESVKTFPVLITDDVLIEGPEIFEVFISAATGGGLDAPARAVVTINDNDDNDGAPNPIDSTAFFVAQQYADFLNRVPDEGGLAFWVGGIESCGTDPQCREVKRVDTSAAFFLSIEFQETGVLVYRMYKAAYGDIAGTPVPVRLRDFTEDAQRIGRGVQVGIGEWQTLLETNRRDYAAEFVTRERFKSAYPDTMTPAEFVGALNAKTGGVLSPDERAALVAGLTGGTLTRGQVMRAVAEDWDFVAAELRRAFVLMQYFGYLRRDPDAPDFRGEADPQFLGYKFWLAKLDQFNGNYVEAEMVRAFISSIEYRNRFGR